MQIDTDKIVEECLNAIRDKIANLATLNIIVAGKTGVGKSTLINSVFREDIADTGVGRPVTEHMRRITKKGFPLTMYDTKGFELNEDVQRQVKGEVMETIRSGFSTNDISKAIHCIWYCVNATSNRIEPEEIEWLRELGNENLDTQVPIIVVLTQCLSQKKSKELQQVIENENLNVVQVIPVLAQDYEIDDEYTAKAFGLDNLIRVMSEALPDELIVTLQHLQKVCLEEKRKMAQAVVAAEVTAAVAAGVAPIPVADCAVLIPAQVSMIAGITAIYGMELNKSFLTAFISAALGAGGATLLGKTVVSNILKLVPGAGSIAGGAISASTAGVITAALGETYILIMDQMFMGKATAKDFQGKAGKERISMLFKEQLSISHS